MKTLYLAGGCFWGTQKYFGQFSGVLATEVGYANGSTENPTYKDVCASSGHAETVRVDYDENVLPTAKLLDYYFMVIDPTSVNKQGGDEGIQYRTGIYYEDESLLPIIQKYCRGVEEDLGQPIVVEVLPLKNFYSAEEYHQKYLDKNPGGYCHIGAHMFNIENK
ncbi:MAG: peptide-methionine (S)-S-oxide reductase MsrA [Clostridia bacterium]|nr:peptide-methionine (S)-S-oxide reductase MsrA [Clostridia bacterium]